MNHSQSFLFDPLLPLARILFLFFFGVGTSIKLCLTPHFVNCHSFIIINMLPMAYHWTSNGCVK